MRILAAAAAYFMLVFAAGFILGVLRTLWLMPRLGERRAELLEAPVMLLAAFGAVLAIDALLVLPPGWRARLAMGGIALFLMLAAELSLVRPLRGVGYREYLAGRDPIVLAAYLVSLLAFALMPAVVGTTL